MPRLVMMAKRPTSARPLSRSSSAIGRSTVPDEALDNWRRGRTRTVLSRRGNVRASEGQADQRQPDAVASEYAPTSIDRRRPRRRGRVRTARPCMGTRHPSASDMVRTTWHRFELGDRPTRVVPPLPQPPTQLTRSRVRTWPREPAESARGPLLGCRDASVSQALRSGERRRAVHYQGKTARASVERTAQLDFSRRRREQVIRTIIDVARRFPVIGSTRRWCSPSATSADGVARAGAATESVTGEFAMTQADSKPDAR